MNVQQPVTDLAQLRGSGRAAVDPAATAPLQVDRTAQQQGIGNVEAATVQPVVECRVGIELGAHIETFGAFTHGSCLGATAQRQLHRVDQDGFSGARFARQYGKTGRQVEFEGAHDHEVAQRYAS